MHTTNFSLAIDNIITFLGTGSVSRAVCRHDNDRDVYYIFESGEPAELEFKERYPGNRKILDMDFFQMKVFIHQIKVAQRELNINGADKENNKSRELAGSDDTGLDAGGTGLEDWGASNNTELPGSNDNGHAGNSGLDSGDKTRSEAGGRPILNILPPGAEEILRENRPEIDR